jgi:hypothetical protein
MTFRKEEKRQQDQITANIRAFFKDNFPPEAFAGYKKHRKGGGMIPKIRGIRTIPFWLARYRNSLPPKPATPPHERCALRSFLDAAEKLGPTPDRFKSGDDPKEASNE